MSDAPTEAASEPTGAPAPEFAVLEVASVLFELPSPSPVLSLMETAFPYRQLDLPVALPEAQALAQVLHGHTPARPGTHDLFASALVGAKVDIVAVRITGVIDGVFRAELDLVSPQGHVVLDCRPSDAVNLALRQRVKAPVLCDVAVLAAHGRQ